MTDRPAPRYAVTVIGTNVVIDFWTHEEAMRFMDHLTLDAARADDGLREALENDVLPWLVSDRGVTRDDVVKRLRKVLAWTALAATEEER